LWSENIISMLFTLLLYNVFCGCIDIFKEYVSRVLVAHACDPCSSGGRDQRDHSLKPVQANSSWHLILKICYT
jgi:hypothetical protein